MFFTLCQEHAPACLLEAGDALTTNSSEYPVIYHDTLSSEVDWSDERAKTEFTVAT